MLLATLYGVTDEVHQRFVPGRTAEVADLIADAVGGSAAASLALLWAWWLARTASRHDTTGTASN